MFRNIFKYTVYITLGNTMYTKEKFILNRHKNGRVVKGDTVTSRISGADTHSSSVPAALSVP